MSISPGKETIAVEVEPAYKQAVKDVAKRRGLNVSVLIRLAIQDAYPEIIDLWHFYEGYEAEEQNKTKEGADNGNSENN